MGAQHSLADRTFSQDETLQDTLKLYEGMEIVLATAFKCMDADADGLVEIVELEPVLRHHVMQLGMLEQLTRICHPNGKINFNEIAAYSRHWGFRLRGQISFEEYKKVAVATLRRLHEFAGQDCEQWVGTMTMLQKDQNAKYHQALDSFVDSYLAQLKSYQRTVDEAYTKEKKFREDWQKNQNLQDQIMQQQQDFIQKMNVEADLNLEVRKAKARNKVINTLFHICRKQNARDAKNNDGRRTVSYLYPCGLTDSGVPVSGGAIEAAPRKGPGLRAALPFMP
ncbi:MAG: hypothetical protein KVP17_002630 [Porospora cf. gigantea B]|uniref:uncharacterized protein n=1 Tax=Porospora cf. gigantea B TaxID=2853592 RepID=UPI003571A787|nr:MAG: hypothetical protein KVP17_002630 [Porospora cf. gigantea B]